MLPGVKVTLSDDVPAPGLVLGAVQAKVPLTDAVPPLNVEEASVCPKVIALAVGQADTVGVAWFTVSWTVVVAVV